MTESMSDLAYVVSVLSLCFLAMYCFIQLYELNKTKTKKKEKIVFMKCEDYFLEETYFIDDIPSAKSRLGRIHSKYHSDLYDKEDER